MEKQKIVIRFGDVPTEHYYPRLQKGDLTPVRGPYPLVNDENRIINLPEQAPNTLLLVNARVLAAAKASGLARTDLRGLPRGFPQDDSSINLSDLTS